MTSSSLVSSTNYTALLLLEEIIEHEVRTHQGATTQKKDNYEASGKKRFDYESYGQSRSEIQRQELPS